MTFEWVAEQAEFERIVDELCGVERYAIDTEFHRERTYYPRLALVQIGWGGRIVLVDPLAVDVTSLRRLFAAPAVAVFHAAQQDLDVLTHVCGGVPEQLLDTQIMAAFVGYSTPSLSALLQGELGLSAPKGDRLTDWLRRPLTAEQQRYAANDVAHLLEVTDRLEAELGELGRLEWAKAACDEARRRPVGPVDPETAWLRIKDVRLLPARSRGVAQSLAAWRERRAAASDVPPRQVLSDLAVVGIAQRRPTVLADLAHARGVDERHSRGGIATEILAAVRDGLDREVSLPVPEGEELDRTLRPAITLVSAWVAEVARRERIDAAMVATRADLVAFLRRDPAARLAQGWRHELLGADVEAIVAGRAALGFDGRGGLRLTAVDRPDAG